MVTSQTQTTRRPAIGNSVFARLSPDGRVASGQAWPAQRPVGATAGRASAIDVGAMAPRDVMAAARLLALGHQRARRRQPDLSAAYQSARPWFVELARGFERKRGVVARERGEVIGFMLAERRDAGETVVTHSVVAGRVDAGGVYSRMCATLSEQR